MPRKKATQSITVRDLDHANDTLREIAELERRISDRENALNAEIDALRAKAQEDLAQAKERLAALDAGITDFAAAYNGYLGNQSVKLTFGSFGWRRTSEVKPAPKMTWAKVMDRLKRLGWTDGVRVTEKVNRDYIRALNDAELAEAGCRRVPLVIYWREINHESVSNAA